MDKRKEGIEEEIYIQYKQEHMSSDARHEPLCLRFINIAVNVSDCIVSNYMTISE